MRMVRNPLVAMLLVWCAVGGMSHAEDAAEMNAESAAAMEAWQQAMTPGAEHAKLADMAGEFKITVKTYEGPGTEPMVSTGRASRKMIMGGRHLEEIMRSEFMGRAFEGRGVIGFNNLTGKYWGTWIDNMSTGVTTSHGDWDFAKGEGVFYGEYIDPMTKEIMETRSVVTLLEGGDERMEMYIRTPTGSFKSMEILFERR